MTKKKLVKTLLDILEDWEHDYSADLDGPNGSYFDTIVEILKEEEEKDNECKV